MQSEFDQLFLKAVEGGQPLKAFHADFIERGSQSEYKVLSESELTALMLARSSRDAITHNFLSAGCYDNFIPAVLTAKKQQAVLAENYQQDKKGIEQELKKLTGVSCVQLINDDLLSLLSNLLVFIQTNSSLGSSESRAKVLIPATVSPAIRNALNTRLKYQLIDVVVVDYDKDLGCLSLSQLQQYDADEVLAVVLAWPNFFGQLENLSEISSWASAKEARLIGLTNPLCLACSPSPFTLADSKLDYLLGDFQVMGFAVNRCGHSPSFIAGSTVLPTGLSKLIEVKKENRDISVIQSYLQYSGLQGLTNSANKAIELLEILVKKLSEIAGVSIRFPNLPVNECVIQIANIEIEKALKILAGHNMVLGYLLQHQYPELENCLLISCTDKHTHDDVDKLVNKVATVVKNLSTAGCPVKPRF